MIPITWGAWFRFQGCTRPEQVRRYAYRCVGAAARNRQNQLRPSSLLRPVATGRVRDSTPKHRLQFTGIGSLFDGLSAPATVRDGVGLRKFGAEQENLGRIVNPKQQYDETAGGTVARSDCAAADVPADQRLPEIEEKRRHQGPDNDVPPLERTVGQNLVDSNKQQGAEQP